LLTLRCGARFWSSLRYLSTHQRPFYPADGLLEHFHRAGEGKANIAGCTEGRTWDAGHIGVVEQ